MTPGEKRLFDKINMLAARIFNDPSHPLISTFRTVMAEELAMMLEQIDKLSTPVDRPWTPPVAIATVSPGPESVTPMVIPPVPPPAPQKAPEAPPIAIEVPVVTQVPPAKKPDKPLLDAWGKPKEAPKPLELPTDKA